MTEPDSKTDEEKFNETLKRMLRTPPTPHDQPAREKRESVTPKSGKKDANKPKVNNGNAP